MSVTSRPFRVNCRALQAEWLPRRRGASREAASRSGTMHRLAIEYLENRRLRIKAYRP
jgi:hypothetical protein